MNMLERVAKNRVGLRTPLKPTAKMPAEAPAIAKDELCPRCQNILDRRNRERMARIRAKRKVRS